MPTKARGNTTLVVLDERMRTTLRIVRRVQINEEAQQYKSGPDSPAVKEWKAAAAVSYFDGNAIGVPEPLLQKLEWAQNQLAMAEGAVIDYLLQNEPAYRRIDRTISAYQLARETGH
jgi:hypothetical protein